jgi:hypothetical protein
MTGVSGCFQQGVAADFEGSHGLNRRYPLERRRRAILCGLCRLLLGPKLALCLKPAIVRTASTPLTLPDLIGLVPPRLVLQ